jgi:hypothetical protein
MTTYNIYKFFKEELKNGGRVWMYERCSFFYVIPVKMGIQRMYSLSPCGRGQG